MTLFYTANRHVGDGNANNAKDDEYKDFELNDTIIQMASSNRTQYDIPKPSTLMAIEVWIGECNIIKFKFQIQLNLAIPDPKVAKICQ